MRSWSWQVNDTGHPVSVGRRMRQMLPHPTYFEFSDEEEAVHTDGWLERHFADELVSLLLHQKPPWPKHRGKELPELMRLAGGLHMWTRPLHEGDHGPWYRPLPPAPLPPEQVDLPNGKVVDVETIANAPTGAFSGDELFSDSEASDEDEAEAEQERAAAKALAAERAETACKRCNGSLGARPVRLAACRHALCECCVLQTTYIFGECPVCGVHAAVGSGKAVGMPKGAADSVTPQPCVTNGAATDEAAAVELAQTARVMADRALLLEYGNTVKPDGAGKTAFKTFVRVLRRGEGSEITRVSFNINPSFNRPTAVVDKPNDKSLGFTFEYAMARKFPCFMKVEFADGLAPGLTIEYSVQTPADGKGCVAHRLAIAPSKLKKRMKDKKGGLTVEAKDCARSLWVGGV
jgi:hypothetical protein